VFWALDMVKNRDTRAPLAPYGGSSEAMGELLAQARARGLVPFANYNRVHMVPPCTISEAETKEGLAILDEVLTTIDSRYYES
jgi:taurine--2-oxoglutarate transaminase